MAQNQVKTHGKGANGAQSKEQIHLSFGHQRGPRKDGCQRAGQARVVDLFAGAGGLSLGFERVGFPVIAAYDCWRPAIDCYRLNFEHAVHKFDLLNVNEAIDHISGYKPDIIIGGPPCQDFSSAGKRREGKNADLTSAFASIVVGCNPKIVVMENVPRARASGTFRNAHRKLAQRGYDSFQTVLDASLCGAPQIRKRFFYVAWKPELGRSLHDVAEYFCAALSTKRLTVRDYMEDELDIEHYYRHPRNYSRRGVFSIDEPSPTIRGVNRPVPPNYRGHPLDTAPVASVRPLTTYERSRIQTFPKSWKWKPHSAKTDSEQLVGNAVPAEMGRFVAQGVAQTLL